MAACCDCSEPHTSPVLESHLDEKTKENWLWLSRQVAAILAEADYTPKVHIAANLLVALKRGGFASEKRDGLDPYALKNDVMDLFGELLLRRLGLTKWCETPLLSEATVMPRSFMEGTSIPSPLRMLLLAKLVTNDVRSLWNPGIPYPAPRRDCSPSDNRSGMDQKQNRIEKKALQSALEAAKGDLKVTAESLEVSYSKLLGELRHHRIRVALSAAASERLGLERITAVHKALAEGVPKSKISGLCGLSEHSILLIEIDRPELCEAHRETTVSHQREKHRNVLLSFLRDSPCEPRLVFARRFPGAYTWLRRNDHSWLQAHLPKSRQGRPGKGSRTHKDWKVIDQVALLAVKKAAHQEHVKSDRPVRLSMRRLLSAADIPVDSHRQHHYPSALAEAERLAETQMQFANRAIRWALQKLAEQNVPISLRRLEALVSIRPERLMEHRSIIIEVAVELGLIFHGRSTLAPEGNDLGWSIG